MEKLTITQIYTDIITLTYPQFTALLKERCPTIDDGDIRVLWNKTRLDEDFQTNYLPKDDLEEFTPNDLRYNHQRWYNIAEENPLDELIGEIFDDLKQYHETEQWEDIYYQGPFVGFCGEHPHLQDFKAATFFQTYGGGPEGGYVRMPDGSVYTIQRTWGTPFGLPEKVDGKLEVKKIDGNWKCRVRKES